MLNNYVAVDLETTGLNKKTDKIIEIGAIKFKEGMEPQVYTRFVKPGIHISDQIVNIVGITDEMVEDAPYIDEIIGEFIEFTEDLPLLGHNLMFDYGFLKQAAVNNSYSFEKDGLDTLKIARKYLSNLESRKLDDLCKYFGIADENHHRAWNDARVTVELYEILCKKFEGCGNSSEKDFIPSPLQYAVKKESPITAKQDKFLRGLIQKHGINFGAEIEKLSKSQASRAIDKIILEYGKY